MAGGRRRHQGDAATPCPQLTRSATGLLIPRLAAAIPRAYENEEECRPKFIRELHAIGALKDDDKADSIEELLGQGVTTLMPTELAAYEDYFGEYLSVYVKHSGIDFSLYQSCHSLRMRLKPIVAALSPEDGRAFIKKLDESVVQGPWFWDQIVGFGEGDAEDGKKWLDDLFDTVPALGGKDKRLQAVFGFLPTVTASNPEVKALIDRFIETEGAARCYRDNGALMVTTWTKDCTINHAHDYINNAIENGDLDNNDQYCFAGSCGNIEELDRAFSIISDCIAAARALEEWSNHAER